MLALAACSGEPERKVGVAPDVLSVFYSCDTRGHIEPCGCDPEMGGIARRMSYYDMYRGDNSLLVDAGNVTDGPRDFELLELEYLLNAYEGMGYHAVNIGQRETMLDAERLRALNANFDLFLSANVMDNKGQPLLPPYRIVEMAKGFRVGIMGIVSEPADSSELGKGLSIMPPGDAVALHLPELTKQTDFVILLAFADEAAMKALAERFFEIDLIVGGDVSHPTQAPLEVNRSAIVAMTDTGKAGARIDIAFAPDGKRSYTSDMQMLTVEFDDDPLIAQIVDDFKLEQTRQGFEPRRDEEEGLTTVTAARSPSANKYVDTEKCRACHEKAFAAWAGSRHGLAFENVLAKSNEYNPRCLKCHATGHEASDGYLNQRLTPHLAKVTCGACHGRGHRHIQLHSGEDVPERSAKLTTPTCTDCHDEENSPRFDAEAYWKKIAHGQD